MGCFLLLVWEDLVINTKKRESFLLSLFVVAYIRTIPYLLL